MKRIALIITVLALAAVTFAGAPGGPSAVNVTSNSTKLVAFRADRRNAPAGAWSTTNLYSQGDVVSANGKFYMAMAGGTSGSTTPSHGNGVGTDDTLNWYMIPSGPRDGVTFQNDTAVDVYLTLGFTAVTNRGILLEANGGKVTIEGYQGAINGILVGNTTNSILVQEF